MNYNGAFNPKYLSGTQLYFAKNTATVSSWNDQSPNGYDLSQAVALQQPTIGTNSVDFVPNQFMSRTGNVFGSDTQGIIFFSGYVTAGVPNLFLVKSTTTTVNNFFYIYKNSATDKIQIIIRNTSLSLNNTFNSDDTFGTGFIYGYLQSNGSSYTLSVNGVIRTFTFTLGSNNGAWFSSMDATNRLSIGIVFRPSPVYLNSSVNKLYYNNTALSASDLWKTEQFFANPLNYD
jgi:hypothetical protein